MRRITEKILKNKIKLLNRITNSPLEYHIGHFALGHGLGYYQLHRVSNSNGGIEVIFSTSSKSQLFALVNAMIAGYELAHALRLEKVCMYCNKPLSNQDIVLEKLDETIYRCTCKEVTSFSIDK